MSHEYDSGVSYEGANWHQLGKVKKGQPANSEQVAIDGGMTWAIDEREFFYMLGDDNDAIRRKVFVPEFKVLTRSDQPETTLSVVGIDYRTLQPSEFLAFGDFICADNAATWASAASLRNGCRLIASWNIKLEAEVLPGDVVRQYLNAFNGNDGFLAWGCGFGQSRLHCHNMLKQFIQLGEKEQSIVKVKHTKNMMDGLALVKEAINLSKRSFDVSIEQYKTIAQKSLPVDGLKRFVRDVFEAEKFTHECCTAKWTSKDETDLCTQCGETTKGIAKMPRNWEVIERLFETAPGQKELEGTYWKAFNAITAWTTHERGRSDSTRYESNLFGDSKRIVKRALEVALDS